MDVGTDIDVGMVVGWMTTAGIQVEMSRSAGTFLTLLQFQYQKANLPPPASKSNNCFSEYAHPSRIALFFSI